MKPTATGLCGSHGSVRAALASGLVALLCTAGVGVALASAPETPAASDESAAGPADVVAFHKELGFDFDELAKAAEKDDMTPAEKSAATVGTREFCLSCHDWDAIVDGTLLPGDVTVYNKKGLYNVHNNHNGEVNCSDCHDVSGEGTSTLGCVSCHYMELPANWHGFY